jgi:hypothetical protein
MYMKEEIAAMSKPDLKFAEDITPPHIPPARPKSHPLVEAMKRLLIIAPNSKHFPLKTLYNFGRRRGWPKRVSALGNYDNHDIPRMIMIVLSCGYDVMPKLDGDILICGWREPYFKYKVGRWTPVFEAALEWRRLHHPDYPDLCVKAHEKALKAARRKKQN